jgi:hypothetical protein
MSAFQDNGKELFDNILQKNGKWLLQMAEHETKIRSA